LCGSTSDFNVLVVTVDRPCRRGDIERAASIAHELESDAVAGNGPHRLPIRWSGVPGGVKDRSEKVVAGAKYHPPVTLRERRSHLGAVATNLALARTGRDRRKGDDALNRVAEVEPAPINGCVIRSFESDSIRLWA
jgi:hypothetical protein